MGAHGLGKAVCGSPEMGTDMGTKGEPNSKWLQCWSAESLLSYLEAFNFFILDVYSSVGPVSEKGALVA